MTPARVLLGLAAALALVVLTAGCTAGAFYLALRPSAGGSGPAAPMPDPAPAPAGPDKPGVLRGTRVEVLDGAGKVVIVLTSENGVPTAIVSDRGRARKIDLAKVARMAD